jgi:putative glutamine amidotransferase
MILWIAIVEPFVRGRRRQAATTRQDWIMSSIPLIAIPGRISPVAENVRGEAFGTGQRYMRAVARAGGQAVMVPPISTSPDRMVSVLSRFDGVILHGGGDVDPRRYGEEPSAEQLYGIVPEHDELEFAVLAAALELDLPVLAICRGMQVLNVSCGGTLHQDLGTEAHWFHTHPVTLTLDSRHAEALGTARPLACHSVHHQGVKDVGDGLRVVGHADDGTIEAMELVRATWIVAVQWHPEDTAHEDPEQQALFDALIARSRHPRGRDLPSR